MPFTPNITELATTNSTTYADLVGLQVGLDRLQGESASDYVKRLEVATHLRREHPYEGALNEINLQLGMIPAKYLHIELPTSTVISVSLAGVIIGTHAAIPVVTFDSDTMWKWRSLSSVVADMNAIASTTLLVDDGPAFQLARQSNSLWSFAEDVQGLQIQLDFSGVIVGSELFNQIVPSYSLTSGGLLTFSVEPPAGTQITYNYVTASYDVVGAPVAMIGLKDPEFASVAANSTSTLAYQVREFIQAIMLEDRSYWAQ